MNAKGKKNIAELLSVLRNSCFTSDHTIESGHWLQCSSLGISMWVNMCVRVCPLHVQVCACPCLCVYASVCVFRCMCGRRMDQGVEGWICALKEERGLDPTLPQLPPVERSQPQKCRWDLGAKRRKGHGSQWVHSQSERNVKLWCYKQNGATVGYGAPIPFIPGLSLQTLSLFG